MKQSEIDAGARAGLSTSEQDELKELRKEVRELRRSNYILQVAATFFGALVEIAGEGNRAVVGRLTNYRATVARPMGGRLSISPWRTFTMLPPRHWTLISPRCVRSRTRRLPARPAQQAIPRHRFTSPQHDVFR